MTSNTNISKPSSDANTVKDTEMYAAKNKNNIVKV